MAIKQETIDKLNSAIENLQTLKESISMLPEEKAGGIESYFTSPLAMQKLYFEVSGKNPTQQLFNENGTPVYAFTDDYVKFLENDLVES
jgi:hypothetical protein